MNLISLPQEIQAQIYSDCPFEQLRKVCKTIRSVVDAIPAYKNEKSVKVATAILFKIISEHPLGFSLLKKQVQWIGKDKHREILTKKVQKHVKARFYGNSGPSRCRAPEAIAVHYQLTQDLECVKKWKVGSDPWLNVELFYHAGKVVIQKEHAEEIGKLLTKYHEEMGGGLVSEFSTYMKPLYFAAQKLKEDGKTLPEEYYLAKKCVMSANHGMYGGKKNVKKLLTFLIDRKFYREAIDFLIQTKIGKGNKDQLFHYLAKKACKEDCFTLSEEALNHLSADCLRVECYTDCSIVQAKKGKREKALELLEKGEKIASSNEAMNPVSKIYPVLGRAHLNSLDELKNMILSYSTDAYEKSVLLKKTKPSMDDNWKKGTRFSRRREEYGRYHDYIRSIYAKKVEDPKQFQWVYQSTGHEKDLKQYAKWKYRHIRISIEKCKTLGRLLAKEEILDPEKLSERIDPYYIEDKVKILNALLKQLRKS